MVPPWDYIEGVVVGQATKSAVGYLRPDFLARCKPLGGRNYTFQPQYGTDTGTICTETNTSLVDDGRSSFPSGARLHVASCMRQSMHDKQAS